MKNPKLVARIFPSLKLMTKGAVVGGVPLFFIAAIAFGFYSGLHGLPTPPATVDDLQASIAEVFSFGN